MGSLRDRWSSMFDVNAPDDELASKLSSIASSHNSKKNVSDSVLRTVADCAKALNMSKDEYASLLEHVESKDGGKGSGNFGHKGRPGKRGGSGEGGGSSAESSSGSSDSSGKSALAMQKAAAAAGKGRVTAGVEYWASRNGKGKSNADAFKEQKNRQDSGTLVPVASRAQIKDAKAYSSGNGVSTKTLSNGSGVTKIDPADLAVTKTAHTLAEHCVKLPDGQVVLTPEREKMHQAAIDSLFSGAQKPGPGEKKVFTMLGGGSAAGKGSIQKSGQVNFPSKEKSPVIDADELKSEIPEYVAEKDRRSAAAYAHEESSAMAKRAMQAAFQNGYNCTLDGTGDGSIEGLRKKIQAARDAGYDVNGTYVTCPTDLAVSRSMERALKTGREVPEGAIRNIHKKVSQIFPKIAPEFDHVELYDTNQGKDKDGNWRPPKLIASCKRGQQIQVHDPELYKAFLDKGNE